MFQPLSEEVQKQLFERQVSNILQQVKTGPYLPRYQ